MSGEEEVLRQKVKLLMLRERELLALRRKHQRLGAWLSLAQSLAVLVDPGSDRKEILRRIAEAFKSKLAFQQVLFFEIVGLSLSPIGLDREVGGVTVLDGPATAILTGDRDGQIRDSEDDGVIKRAVGLHRFLWHRIDAPDSNTLLVAGYDHERAAFYPPFDESDMAQFAMSGRQLDLLLGNIALVRELAQDKRRLEEFNATLESKVRERTFELADVNRSLQQALVSLREKERYLTEDIEQARLFQQKTLPLPLASSALDVATAYLPLERVGGDVFDVCELAPGRFRAFIADATGHGVQASMRTILCKAEYDRLKHACREPHEVLTQLSARLFALFPEGEMMSTACCVDLSLDARGAEVAYANAANPALLHFSAGRCMEVYAEGAFLGLSDSPWNDSTRFHLTRGDVLLTFSDGLSDQRGPTGTFEARLSGMNPARCTSAAEAVESVLREFDVFRGTSPVEDDLTLIAIHVPHNA